MHSRNGLPAWSGAALLWVGLAALPAAATQFRWMDLDEMVRRADDVVRAVVLDIRVETDPESHAHYTVTRFQVVDTAIGTLRGGDELELRLLGGQAPDSGYRTSVTGIPRFDPGEERVLFLRRMSDGRHLLVGERGALRLQDTDAGPVVIGAPGLAPAGLQPTVRLVPAPVRRSDRPAAPMPEVGPEPAARIAEAARRVAPSGPPSVEEFFDRVRRLSREENRP